ncbi:MAG: hypothetical protein AB1304_02935 [Bacteroidota bacterium]
MEVLAGNYTFSTNNLVPPNCNFYHFRTLYNTTTAIDGFIVTPMINNITIKTNSYYLLELKFFGSVDAQANTNSVAELKVFGFSFLSIRAYEPPINCLINNMQLVIQATETTPIRYVPNSIQFRILAAGTILITPINI